MIYISYIVREKNDSIQTLWSIDLTISINFLVGILCLLSFPTKIAKSIIGSKFSLFNALAKTTGTKFKKLSSFLTNFS